MSSYTISVENLKIPLNILRRKNMRYIRLSVRHDGSVNVSVPKFLPKYFINKFILSHQEWILQSLGNIKDKSKDNLFLTHDRKHYAEYKEKARIIIHERLAYFNTLYNFSYNKVFIKNQRSVWGSCSKKRNLNFNYKILFLPQGLQDYIVVHELCHLKEFNHGRKFWDLVSKTIPDYKERREQVKQYTQNESIC